VTKRYNKTKRITVRRKASRGKYDAETINAILDAGIFGHVGIVADDGQPFVIPVIYARSGEHIYIHGSPVSRLLRTLADGVRLCLTVTLLDGLVLARSGFHSSLNYRSAVVLGEGHAVEDEDEKQEALRQVVDHVIPGRSDDARGPDPKELRNTQVIKLAIEEASAKIRTGPPIDDEEDYAMPIWAGVVPVGLALGEPVPDDRCDAPLPDYVRAYPRAFNGASD
jgi:nitroimidazol reductase NimA-like FMN-containing flavoprotein (pyridoxamine 5'-phosphate oxidase superfamily)